MPKLLEHITSLKRINRVFWESWGPFVFSLLTIIIILRYQSKIDFQQYIAKNYEVLLSVQITLIGFLLTILTIIKSFNNKNFDVLRKSGLEKRLITYLTRSIFLTAYSIGCIMLYSLIMSSEFELISFQYATKKNLGVLALIILISSWLYVFRFLKLLKSLMT